MTHPRLVLRVLMVSLVSGLLVFPVAGLRSSLAQETGRGAIAHSTAFPDTTTQSSMGALAEGLQCPQDGIAYWKLDETSGPPYEDSYDGHGGLCAGACPSSAVGQVNGGQTFDGSSTGIDVSAHAAFGWGKDDSFSIEFWMYRDGSTGTNEVVVGRDDASISLHWWTGILKRSGEGGHAAFVLQDTGGTIHLLIGTTVINDGVWHHVVAVRDGSNDQLHLYVDGLPDGVTNNADYSASFASPTAAVNIGWIDIKPGYYYRYGGTLDELAIHNRALTAAEVRAHHAAGRAGQGYCSNPGIAVEKTADPTIVYAGETVVYSYAVTNTGDVPLVNLDVNDDTCSPVNGPQDGDGDADLDPSEVWIYTCSMDLSRDTTNTVTATGTYTYPVSGTTSGTDAFSVEVIVNDVVVNKTADPAVIYPGTTVTYTYAATNQGNDTISNVSMSDDKCAPVIAVIGDTTLSVGETQTYACSVVVSEDITNTATLVGTDRLGATQTFTGQAFVDVVTPTVTVRKTADPTIIYSGDTVTYTYTVMNDGNDILEDIGLTDDKCAPVNPVGSNDGRLAPGETVTYQCQKRVTSDAVNIATFSGTDLLGSTWTYTDTASVNVINPQISVDKRASATAVYAGETVVYTYTVRNPGDDPLSSVDVIDDKCSPVTQTGGDTNANGKLDMDETWTYVCSAALDTSTLNKATASGTDSLGSTLSTQDTAFVSVIRPQIAIEKTADKSEVPVGEIVKYTYTVWNTGDDPLSEVTVGDDKCSPVSFTGGDSNGNAKLDLGERWAFTCSTAHSSPGDTTNTAIVTGLDSTGRRQRAQDTATVVVVVGNHLIYLPILLRAQNP